jgi:hypothetical protein
LGIHSNIFSSKTELQKADLTTDIYRIDGVSRNDNRFRKLSYIRENLSRRLRVPVILYSSGESDFAMALEPNVEVILDEMGFVAKLEKKGESLLNYPQQLREFHYDAARSVLEKHGMWKYTYNRYFEFFPEKTIDTFEIYRGICFRCDLFEHKILLTIDPTTRVTTRSTIWELISKLGKEEAKKQLMNRYVLATQEKGKSIYQISKIDFDKNVNDNCIQIADNIYSVKGYFRRPGGRPELADSISDDECIVSVRRGLGAMELSMAPSLLKLILKTDDFPRERTLKSDLMNEVYLSAERRRILTQKFLTILNPLPLGTSRSTTFELKDVSQLGKEANVLPPPHLIFGGKTSFAPDFSRYGSFMKNTLRELGPAKKATFSSDRVILVYPSTVSKGMMRTFYDDCKWISRSFFRAYLPERPVFYNYPDVDVRKEYESFGNDVDAVIAVIQDERENERYLNFKEWFTTKPNQVLTYRVINEKYLLPKEQVGRYRNLVLNVCAGLLGKMGGRPWILDKRLSADFYVGLDVGGEKRARVACFTFFDELGNYLGEEWRPQRAEEIDPVELRRIIVNTVKLRREHVNSMVFHRDGEFTDRELDGISQVKSDLIKEGVMSDNSTITCVNIKKTVPYRLYEVLGEKQDGCKIGSYLLLDAHNAILATSGAPLLRQGTARPLLVELVPPYDTGNIRTTVQDIYYLSFMHWGSILLKMKLPATLRYADALTPFALRNIRVTGVPL